MSKPMTNITNYLLTRDSSLAWVHNGAVIHDKHLKTSNCTNNRKKRGRGGERERKGRKGGREGGRDCCPVISQNPSTCINQTICSHSYQFSVGLFKDQNLWNSVDRLSSGKRFKKCFPTCTFFILWLLFGVLPGNKLLLVEKQVHKF